MTSSHQCLAKMHEIRLTVSANHLEPGVSSSELLAGKAGFGQLPCPLQPPRAQHGCTAEAAKHFITSPRWPWGVQSSALLIQHLAQPKPAKSEQGEGTAFSVASRSTCLDRTLTATCALCPPSWEAPGVWRGRDAGGVLVNKGTFSTAPSMQLRCEVLLVNQGVDVSPVVV